MAVPAGTTNKALIKKAVSRLFGGELLAGAEAFHRSIRRVGVQRALTC
jgi:hypothetical protein